MSRLAKISGKKIKKILYIFLFGLVFFSAISKVSADRWEKKNDHWLYMDKDQKPVKGWKQIAGRWFYFHEDGRQARSQWIENSYVGAGGERVSNRYVNGKYLDKEGKTKDLFLGDCKFIAHRGLSNSQPENSRDAFIWAGQNGFWGAECDVWLTKDHRYVLIHDISLKREFGIEANVTDLTMAQAQSYQIGEMGGIKNYSPVHMLSLEEYLDIFADYPSMHPIIELKMDFSREQLSEITEMIRSKGLWGRACIISFLPNNLTTLRELHSDLNLQLLTDKMDDSALEWCKKHKVDISAADHAVNKESVKRFHDAGIKVAVWTVDDKEKALDFIYHTGVDYITSNVRLFN